MTDLYQLNDIRFSYGETLALALPSLVIKAGKKTALIGPNGSGKSTLLNLLTFLESPDTGKIRFQGNTITAKHYASFRRRIGFLPQKPYMLRGSVADNLKLALKLHGFKKTHWPLKISQVLERLNIAQLHDQKATGLSGGELQKSALARALITEPEVLILDEPFSYLDQAGIQSLEQLISDYAQDTGKTLIFSTHNRFQGLALADEVISLLNGKQANAFLANPLLESAYTLDFGSNKLSTLLPIDMPAHNPISKAQTETELSGQNTPAGT